MAQKLETSWRSDVLHISTLSCLSVATPLLDMLGAQAEFFISRRSNPIDVPIMVLGLLILPPLIPVLTVLLARMNKKLYRVVFSAWFVVFCALFLMPFVRGLPTVFAVSAAIVISILLSVLYWKEEVLRKVLSFFSLMMLIMPVMFFSGGVSRFVFQEINANQVYENIPAGPPVVVIVFDEFPLSELLTSDGKLDRTRFPNFSRLADIATWYPNACSIGDNTNYVLPGLLTGRWPEDGKNGIVSDYPDNLFTLLASSYDCFVVEAVTRLAPQVQFQYADESLGYRLELLFNDLQILYLHRVLPQGLANKLPSVKTGWRNFGRRSRERIPRDDGFRNFLDTIGSNAGSELHFFHTNLPHFPYEFLPSGKRYDDSNDSFAAGIDGQTHRWKTEWESKQTYQRHLLQAGFADKLLGELLDRLEENGRLDASALIVTADHGASFRVDGEFRALTEENVSDILPVPLFIKAPGQTEGRVDDGIATSLDVLPTLAKHLGITIPWEVDGSSLTENISRDEELVAYATFYEKKRVKFRGRELWKDSVQFKSSLFGSGDWEKVYSFGPLPELIGKETKELREESSGFRVRLRFRELWENFQPGSEIWPVRITGSLDQSPTQNLFLAVALNGKVSSVTIVTPHRAGHFSSMVSPSFFKEGYNELELFLVRPGPGSTYSLVPLVQDGYDGFQVSETAITGPDGQQFPLTEDYVIGFVDEIIEIGSSSVVRGWAIDRVGQGPASKILIFEAGKCIASAPLVQYRSDVNATFGAEYARSGFNISIPQSLVSPDDVSSLEFFAVSPAAGAGKLKHVVPEP